MFSIVFYSGDSLITSILLATFPYKSVSLVLRAGFDVSLMVIWALLEHHLEILMDFMKFVCSSSLWHIKHSFANSGCNAHKLQETITGKSKIQLTWSEYSLAEQAEVTDQAEEKCFSTITLRAVLKQS